MNTLFIVAATVAVLSSAMAVSRSHAVHALLYLIVSLLSTAVIFFILGAPFAAALEVIIYAGAVMVLFLFVIMMMNRDEGVSPEKKRQRPTMWAGPALLAFILAVELGCILWSRAGGMDRAAIVGSRDVGMRLYGPYLLGVELASMLMLAGLVGACHLARREHSSGDKEEGDKP